MSEKMKTAKAGDELTARAACNMRKASRFWESFLTTKEACTVQPKSDAQAGQWVCIDCGAHLRNNFEAHGHTKSHRRAWWTGERFEEP